MTLGAEMPEGVRFVGPEADVVPKWSGPDFPTDADLDSCVACGLCLPHCPTYRLTGEESASPRGRIAAMRTVAEGRADVDPTFVSFMDLCLSCRACEDVCPSHVPFGRMMERARVQAEPLRSRRARFLRWLGLEVVLPHAWLLSLATALAPVARLFMPARLRALTPRMPAIHWRLPTVTEPDGKDRGTVTLLTGCVQDRWFREVNLGTIRVLARNGWRVVVPRTQTCCGALHAHGGDEGFAHELMRRKQILVGQMKCVLREQVVRAQRDPFERGPPHPQHDHRPREPQSTGGRHNQIVDIAGGIGVFQGQGTCKRHHADEGQGGNNRGIAPGGGPEPAGDLLPLAAFLLKAITPSEKRDAVAAFDPWLEAAIGVQDAVDLVRICRAADQVVVDLRRPHRKVKNVRVG